MTLDELLQQLMKIKEVYSDSGKILMVINDADTGWNLKLSRVIKEKDRVILESNEYNERVE